ncbi:hypothetical protein [Pseudomonas frederiksbergensis]|uniref:hypothetical protein n=1 Tax=Pseudomonas frederiksbergensis TaxID=104087 RepID=UPI003D215990
MKILNRSIISGTAIALFSVSVGALAASDETCYTIKTENRLNESTGRYENKLIKTRKNIHIDVNRPDIGKAGTETTYDASGSTTPSGKVNYKWETASGGFGFIGPTDQAQVIVKTDDASGVNAYTRITIIDPECKIANSSRIDVNYYP